jgi:hypothetical protein
MKENPKTVLKEQNEKLAARLAVLDAENAKLKTVNDKRIDTQNAKIAALEGENARLAAIFAKVESLEKTVDSLQTKAGALPVALNQ